jgi:Holliday junction resolvasome RuvABC endonuclease subunit
MNHHTPNQFRLLAIELTSHGLGYAVLEGEKSLVESGYTSVRKEDKNKQCLTKVEKLVSFYRPDVLVLQDVTAKGSRRAPRIKRLHRSIMGLAKKQKIKTEFVSGRQIRSLLLGEAKGTKHQLAEMLAKGFPDELALRLPRKRRAWESADSRMDMFDAVALAVAFRMRENTEALDLRK